MSQIFAPVKNPSNEKYLVVAMAEAESLNILVVGYKSKRVITEFIVTPDKAVTFLPKGYSNVMIFGLQLRDTLVVNGIPNFFYSGRSLFVSGMLIHAKIKCARNDIFYCLLIKENHLVIMEYLFNNETGYEQVREDDIQIGENSIGADIREKILRGNKPKHIIAFGADKNSSLMKKLKNEVFSQEKIVILDKTFTKDAIMHALKISKYALNRRNVKYHVIPKCAKKYRVCIGEQLIPIMAINFNERIPCSCEETLPKIMADLQLVCYDKPDDKGQIIYTLPIEYQSLHRCKLTFNVDRESFAVVQIKPQLLDFFNNLPEKLESMLTDKIPVIVFCDNFTVICAVKKGEFNYSFLDGWNGIYGNNASIYVNTHQRLYGFEAVKMKKKYPANCLIDITQLLSQPNLSTIEDPVFKQGYNREAVVRFLLSHLLEEHFTVIRSEIGTAVVEVAFWFALNYDDEKYGYVKDRLINSLRNFEIKFRLLNDETPE